MTAKQFFKSTAFKSVVVLMAIVIIAGALLAIFNDLLKVSDEERDARTMPDAYSAENIKERVLNYTDPKITVNGHDIERVFLMDDDNYLIKVTGNGGYSGGSITVWVTMECTGTGSNLVWKGIKSVDYASNEKQSYIGRFTDADYAQFAEHNSQLLEGKLFDDGIEVIKTGASAPATMGALTDAVNSAVTYFKTAILGQSEEDAYLFASWVDLENSEWEINRETRTIDYTLVMKKNKQAPSFTVNVSVQDNTILSYSHTGDFATGAPYDEKVDESIRNYSLFIGKSKAQILALVNEDGSSLSGKLDGLTTGATRSTESFLYAAAFAVANYEDLLYTIEYGDKVDHCEATVEGTSVSYVLTMKKNKQAPAFTVNVTVDETGITAYSHTGDFATGAPYDEKVDESIRNYSLFIGKSKAQILALVNEDGSSLSGKLDGLTTGATRSTESFLYAAAYAVANYDVYLAKGGTQA